MPSDIEVWIAEVVYTDATGKARSHLKVFECERDARECARKMEAQIGARAVYWQM